MGGDGESVRTTLTLDDDVAAALKERARVADLPFRQVVLAHAGGEASRPRSPARVPATGSGLTTADSGPESIRSV